MFLAICCNSAGRSTAVCPTPMSTIPHPTAPFHTGSGVWDDVAIVVSALGSSLEPGKLVASVRDVLTGRCGQTATVMVIDREMGRLKGPEAGASTNFHPGLAAALQLNVGPVPIAEEWAPGKVWVEGSALGLRDGDVVTAVAFFTEPLPTSDESLPVVAAMCGSALARSDRFDQLARLTGDSEQTRNLQQQILDHVSHEFNTPLLILRSSAEFVRDCSGQERELFLDMHSQALDRLEQLVSGVIEVAHASAHGETEELTIEDIVSKLVLPHFVDHEWPHAAVPMLWHRPASVSVRAEKRNLGLAIEHLLRNAHSYAASVDAPVAVAIYPARSDEPTRPLAEAVEALVAGAESVPHPAATADSILIEVIDAGSGIPTAELGLIFEPFTQASNSPLRGVSGAGMGLATARRLVQAMGGRLEVESSLGTGSLFRVRLPAS